MLNPVKSFHQIILILLISFTIISSASAKYIPKVAVEVEKNGNAYLVVNCRRTIDFVVKNGSMSPAERAKTTSDRLNAHIAKGLNLEYISYKKIGSVSKVLIDDQLLVIATQDDAKAHKVSSEELASTWIKNLRDSLSVPPLSASPSTLLVPLGETRALSIESLQSNPVEAIVSDPAIISADPNPKPGSLIIKGKALGDASITLRCGDAEFPVQVSVKKYAAYISMQEVKATVTGWNAPADLVARVARDAARKAISIEQGAELRSVDLAGNVKELEPGKSIQAIIKINAAGSSYIPAQLNIPVTVDNEILPVRKTSWIMYSNDPEQIKKYQTLFIGRLDQLQESMRLLYHHQNMMGKEIGFVIDIINPSSSQASFHVIEGIANPMVDTVIVGYKAGLEFMENHRSFVGRVVNLPPGTRWPVLSQTVSSLNTASGIMELRQLTGEPLYVRIMAKPESLRVSDDPSGIALSANGITPEQLQVSDYVYPEPTRTIDTTFTAGKPWIFLRIGKNAIKHATQDKLLYGNYGVTYQINAKLENPTAQALNVELVYEATAGPVSGIFFVDGKLSNIKLLNPPNEKVITKILVPAGQTKPVSIYTMPLSGSAYPATLVIRPAGTMASMSSD